IMRQAIADQRRVELVGLAVDVEIGAREMGVEQGAAERAHKAEQLLDIGVLRAPQRQRVELGARQEGAWIDAAAMWGVEHQGSGKLGRLRHLKGGRKLLLDRLSLVSAHRLNLVLAGAGRRGQPGIAYKLCQ